MSKMTVYIDPQTGNNYTVHNVMTMIHSLERSINLLGKRLSYIESRLPGPSGYADIEHKQEVSEPKPESGGLFVRTDDEFLDDEFKFSPATPAQVRAEAVRLGLLDTPRQKVERELLCATISFHYDYIETAKWLRGLAQEHYASLYSPTLFAMAAVLTQAAKGEGNG
jgi:hypothetical protein